MRPETILYIILAIVAFNFLLGRLLSYLNWKNRKKDLPASLMAYYDAEKYSASYAYHKENYRLAILQESISFVTMFLFLLLGGFAWVNNWLAAYISQPIWLALSFFAVLGFAGSLLSLPFGLYSTFVIEEKYGFNRTSVKTFITDKLKGMIMTIILGGILGYFMLWLVLELGPQFWLYAWVAAACLILFINLFYTSLILPIFNKLTPLPESSLRQKIEAYAASVKFPLTNILIIDGSKRSSKANAFFSGIGRSKKIVLYDTLIEKHTEEELVAVLAHEVGHYKHKHIVTGLFLSLAQTGFMLWLLSRFLFSEELSLALGAGSMQIHLNLIAFSILFEPISLLTGIGMNMLSRKNEFQADAFAGKTYDKEAFKNALKKLGTDNLTNLEPHPAYVFFHYSHPPLLQRIKALK